MPRWYLSLVTCTSYFVFCILEIVHGIALRSVKYSDTASIVTVWSVELGRMAVSLPSGSSREARRRKALMMPLGAFEAVAHLKPGQEIARLSDVRQISPSPAASGNPAKSAVAMFLSEFLYAVLKESAPDPNLGQFLINSIRELNEAQGTALANFHLMLLYRLGHFLGIEPDMGTYSPNAYFDLKEARFSTAAPLHAQFLTQEQSRAVRLLSRLNSRNLHLMRLSRDQRNQILDYMLQYYSLHHAPLTSPPSLEILRTIYN